LADNIDLLLANDDLRVRLAESGCQSIQDFKWERSADRLEELLS
jgi:glycosyltransferase involved in cell wall biosynthesis